MDKMEKKDSKLKNFLRGFWSGVKSVSKKLWLGFGKFCVFFGKHSQNLGYWITKA